MTKRKLTVSGPLRKSMRLRERFCGKKIVSTHIDPIDITLSTPTPPPSPEVAPQETPEQEQMDTEVQSDEPQQSVDANQESESNQGNDTFPASETPVEAVHGTPYSNPRFINQKSEDRYTSGYVKRAVLCERGIQLDDYAGQPFELKEMIETRNWHEWVSVNQKAIVPLVKEFYSNATKGPDERKEIHTTVRRKPIVVTPELIAQVGAFPLINIPAVTPQQQLEWDEKLSKVNLARLLTGNDQSQWEKARMSRADLNDKSKVLHLLVCSKFLPHAYVSTVTVAQAEFIGKLLLDIPIDLANHVWTTIAAAVDKPDVNSGLPFGGLITKIVQRHGVKGKAGMDMVTPAARIAKTSVKRSQGQLARRTVVGSSSEQPPAGEGKAEEITLQSLFDLVREGQRKQDEFMAEVRSWRATQEHFNDQALEMLNGLFES